MIELPGLLINRSGDTGALDIAKAFFLTRFGMLVVFTNLRLMEFQVSYLVLFCSFFSVVDGFFFFSSRRLQVALDGKSSQECPVNARVPQGSILGCTHFSAMH